MFLLGVFFLDSPIKLLTEGKVPLTNGHVFTALRRLTCIQGACINECRHDFTCDENFLREDKMLQLQTNADVAFSETFSDNEPAERKSELELLQYIGSTGGFHT